MRLKEYIKENYKPTKSEIEKGKKWIAKDIGVDPKFVEFAFVWDTGVKDMIFLTYNIMDPKSKFYKSSKNYRVK